MAGPLEGIRVLNWSQFTPSSAGYILGDLGADVIKIEHPVQGDAYRGMGTMYGSAMSMKGGRHAGFEAVNRNQRSMTLDLKQAAGRGILYQLVERCDVFFTNYTRRVANDLQADYATLSAKKPDLIYAVSSTYGPEGPWAERRGFGQTAQGRSGLMFAVGERGFPEPGPTGTGVADNRGASTPGRRRLAAAAPRSAAACASARSGLRRPARTGGRARRRRSAPSWWRAWPGPRRAAWGGRAGRFSPGGRPAPPRSWCARRDRP